jgi:2-keto-4-pentenoate hydratase
MPVPEKPYPVIDELSQELDGISRRLVAARTNAEALPDFPGKLPDSLPEAYAIQSASIVRWPDEVAGWKVGMVPAELRASLSAERLVGPIFRSSIHKVESGSCRTMPIFKGGFAAL